MRSIHDEFNEASTGIGSLKRQSHYRSKRDPNHTKYSQMHGICITKKPFRAELYGLQKWQMIIPLGVDATPEWCKGFMLVLKLNTKVECALTQANLIKY